MRLWVAHEVKEADKRCRRQGELRPDSVSAIGEFRSAKSAFEIYGLNKPITSASSSKSGTLELLENVYSTAQRCRSELDEKRGNENRPSSKSHAVKKFRDRFRAHFLSHDVLLEDILKKIGELLSLGSDSVSGYEAFAEQNLPSELRQKFAWYGIGHDAMTTANMSEVTTENDALHEAVFSPVSLRILVHSVRIGLNQAEPPGDVRLLSHYLSEFATTTNSLRDNESRVPTLWFLINLLLELLRVLPTAEREKRLRLWLKIAMRRARSGSRELRRTSVTRDPLRVLSRNLRVSRFLTTNYDLELESMFRSLGFELSNTGELAEAKLSPDDYRFERTNNVGEKSVEFVFSPAAASSIVDFALEEKADLAYVLHLHGRALPHSKLAITEGDYVDYHASEVPGRQTSLKAMELVFTSNPLVFVGLGMTEPDILRPLRTFSDGTGTLSDRPAIAILARYCPISTEPCGEREIERRVKAKLQEKVCELLDKYGVYSVHYGAATCKRGQTDRYALAKILHEFDKVTKSYQINDALTELEQFIPPGTKAAPDELCESRLDELWEKVEPGLMAVLQNRNPFRKIASRVDKIVSIESTHYESDAKQLMLSMLNLIEPALVEWTNRLLVDRRLLGNVVWKCKLQGLLRAYVELASGLASDIHTVFLTAYLSSLSGATKRWQEDWSTTPSRREPVVPDPVHNSSE